MSKRKTTIGKGLGGSPSRLLEFGEAWDKVGVHSINLIGIQSQATVGKPRIQYEYVYIQEATIIIRPTIWLKSIPSRAEIGKPTLIANIDGARIDKRKVRFGNVSIIYDKWFSENLEEEEILTAFLLAA